MVEREIIDALTYRGRDMGVLWKDAIRKAPQLKHYNALEDDKLIEFNGHLYPVLAKTLEHGMDRSLVGNYFVRMGKDRMRLGFPVSEILYALNLSQNTVIEFLLSELPLDNSLRMYQTVDAIKRISGFFLLSSFYITKGFLEETYTSMNMNEEVSEELLKRYFRDDFFFKQ
jgi:hypothetical protein